MRNPHVIQMALVTRVLMRSRDPLRHIARTVPTFRRKKSHVSLMQHPLHTSRLPPTRGPNPHEFVLCPVHSLPVCLLTSQTEFPLRHRSLSTISPLPPSRSSSSSSLSVGFCLSSSTSTPSSLLEGLQFPICYIDHPLLHPGNAPCFPARFC